MPRVGGMGGINNIWSQSLNDFFRRLHHSVAGIGQVGPFQTLVGSMVYGEERVQVRVGRVDVLVPDFSRAAIRQSEEVNGIAWHPQMAQRRARLIHAQRAEVQCLSRSAAMQ